MRPTYAIAGFGVFALMFGGVSFAVAGPPDVKSCAQGPIAAALPSDPAAKDRWVLGMEWERGRPYLARLDTRTLAAHGDPDIPVSTVATISPDETGFVSGLGGDYVPDGGGMRLKFVDLPKMRVAANVPLGAGGGVHSVHWFANDRVMAVAGQPARVFVVDATKYRLLDEVPLHVDQVFEVRRTDDAVVVLVSAEPGSARPSESRIAPTRIHVVTTAGELRSTHQLDVNAGYEFDPDVGGRHAYPGLAVDDRGISAFIVESPQRVAEVDLSSMAVTYRTVGEPPSLWSGLLSFFGSVVEAKLSTGPSMHAHYVGNGSLLVEGVNEGVRRSPVHMTLIDTKTWEACRLDAEMSNAAVGDDVIVAWDSIGRLGQGRAARNHNSEGVAVYDLRGRKVFEVLRQTPVCWLDLTDHTAYAYKCGNGAAAIDLDSGDVRHLRPGRPIELVTSEMSF